MVCHCVVQINELLVSRLAYIINNKTIPKTKHNSLPFMFAYAVMWVMSTVGVSQLLLIT